jgi:N-acetylmuramoyl-L-alanine amidase
MGTYKEINQYLTGKSKTGKDLDKVKGLVIHWFADPMAKAKNVINWWQGQHTGVSAHDVIDLNGDLYHAVHYDQMAYQVGCPRGYTKAALQRLSSYPNNCVVGVECAHLDWDGTMTKETYDTLVEWAVDKIKEFHLTVNDLWLHSEIVGKDYKDCHRWFTTTKPSDWQKFKDEVAEKLKPKPITYVVQKGDTLWGIAKDHKTTVAAIKKLNNLKTDVIQIGQVLKYK